MKNLEYTKMRVYDLVKAELEKESSLPPGKRRQAVPCAFCTRGGNGDGSCGSGGFEKRYNKFRGCFAGTMKENL